MEEDFDLEKIDTEMRLEKIRQSASKLTWENFGHSLRRNLMEKRIVFDAESRMDVIQAINFMRRSLPVDANADIMGKLNQLADGLECHFSNQDNLIVIKNAEIHIELTYDDTITSCKIGYFGRLAEASDEACALIHKGDYESLRNAIYSIQNVVPSLHNSSDKMKCVSALETVEAWLFLQSGQPTFDKVNTLPFGWLQKRDTLRPSRIFYVAEPYYVLSTERKEFDVTIDCSHLPYLEISLVHNSKELDLPNGNANDPWSLTTPMAVCFCLRFSVPMLFSDIIWRRMEKYLARPSIVRQHVNAYRYTSDFDFKTSDELVLRSCFPSHITQHRYIISADVLKDETDVVIGELYIEDMRNLDKVIQLIRTQEMHNTLWESFLSMCAGRWRGGFTIKLRVFPSATRFEVQFSANDRLFVVRIEQSRETKEWSAVMKKSDGSSISPDIDRQLTTMLLRSHNLPCTLTRAMSAIQARGSPDPVEPSSPTDSPVISSFLDKIGDAWLPQPKPPRLEESYVYEVEKDENPIALLASFKEFEDVYAHVPTRSEPLPRSVRQSSDQSYAHAFSDLEAICQIADQWEGDSKSSTPPVLSSRFDNSPAQRMGGITQLSPLETARLRMAQSVSAASAGHPSTPDVFDFPDDRSGGSGSSYPSPSPHSNPFGYNVSSPLGRGGAVGGKRRPRQRKGGNLGDRTASTDSLTGHDPFTGMPPMQKKPRISGKPAIRKPRGSRKSSGLPVTHQELEMQQRPTLQRSYSDYVPISSFPATPTSGDSPYADDDSDDETCDPPPPPKNILAAAAAASQSQAAYVTQVSSPAFQHHPSPLSVPSSDPSSSYPTRVQPQRKTSLDMAPPSKKPATPVPQPRKTFKSDIYDDGVDSPPDKYTSSATLASSVSQSSTQSPLAYGSPKGEISSDGQKPDSSKIILKISKSRASPSVDVQKAKISTTPVPPPIISVPKTEKTEKKKKEPREKDREKEKVVKERKRKADSNGKERDSKRPKSDTSGSSKQKTPVNVVPFLSNTLKNFKIPKKEDMKDSSKEPATPTTPVAPTLPSPVAAPPTQFMPVPPPIPQPHKSSMSRKSSTHAPPMQRASYGQPPSMHMKKSHEQRRNKEDSHRDSIRSSLGHHHSSSSSSSHMHTGPPVSSIPLPKTPHPTATRPSTLPTTVKPSYGNWVKPPTLQQQPPPRSPSPDDAMQVDDEANSPEDSLRIAEE